MNYFYDETTQQFSRNKKKKTLDEIIESSVFNNENFFFNGPENIKNIPEHISKRLFEYSARYAHVDIFCNFYNITFETDCIVPDFINGVVLQECNYDAKFKFPSRIRKLIFIDTEPDTLSEKINNIEFPHHCEHILWMSQIMPSNFPNCKTLEIKTSLIHKYCIGYNPEFGFRFDLLNHGIEEITIIYDSLEIIDFNEELANLPSSIKYLFLEHFNRKGCVTVGLNQDIKDRFEMIQEDNTVTHLSEQKRKILETEMNRYYISTEKLCFYRNMKDYRDIISYLMFCSKNTTLLNSVVWLLFIIVYLSVIIYPVLFFVDQYYRENHNDNHKETKGLLSTTVSVISIMINLGITLSLVATPVRCVFCADRRRIKNILTKKRYSIREFCEKSNPVRKAGCGLAYGEFKVVINNRICSIVG